MNLLRCRPRYYFEKFWKILSPRLDDRLVGKMASDGETPFKDLQSWTILLVGRVREKIRGPGSCKLRCTQTITSGVQGRSRTGDDGPRPLSRAGRGSSRLASCARLNRLALQKSGGESRLPQHELDGTRSDGQAHDVKTGRTGLPERRHPRGDSRPLLFGSAGRWDLPLFWAYLGVWSMALVVAVFVVDPALIEERMRPGPGGEDFASVAR